MTRRFLASVRPFVGAQRVLGRGLDGGQGRVPRVEGPAMVNAASACRVARAERSPPATSGATARLDFGGGPNVARPVARTSGGATRRVAASVAEGPQAASWAVIRLLLAADTTPTRRVEPRQGSRSAHVGRPSSPVFARWRQVDDGNRDEDWDRLHGTGPTGRSEACWTSRTRRHGWVSRAGRDGRDPPLRSRSDEPFPHRPSSCLIDQDP